MTTRLEHQDEQLRERFEGMPGGHASALAILERVHNDPVLAQKEIERLKPMLQEIGRDCEDYAQEMLSLLQPIADR